MVEIDRQGGGFEFSKGYNHPPTPNSHLPSCWPRSESKRGLFGHFGEREKIRPKTKQKVPSLICLFVCILAIRNVVDYQGLRPVFAHPRKVNSLPRCLERLFRRISSVFTRNQPPGGARPKAMSRILCYPQFPASAGPFRLCRRHVCSRDTFCRLGC